MIWNGLSYKSNCLQSKEREKDRYVYRKEESILGEDEYHIQIPTVRIAAWARSTVLVHSRRQFLRGVPSQFTEAHLPWTNRPFTESVPHLRELTSSFTESMKNYKSSMHHWDPYNRMPLGRPDATTITLCSMSSFETSSSFSFPSSFSSSSLLSSSSYSASSPVTPSSSGTSSSSVSRSVKSLLSLVLTRDLARWLH